MAPVPTIPRLVSVQMGFLIQLVARVRQSAIQTLEIIHRGVFGRVTATDGAWEFCWDNGSYTQNNDCFESLKQEYNCWIRPHKVAFCIGE